jgi:hypothetical protein
MSRGPIEERVPEVGEGGAVVIVLPPVVVLVPTRGLILARWNAKTKR